MVGAKVAESSAAETEAAVRPVGSELGSAGTAGVAGVAGVAGTAAVAESLGLAGVAGVAGIAGVAGVTSASGFVVAAARSDAGAAGCSKAGVLDGTLSFAADGALTVGLFAFALAFPLADSA